MTRERSIVAQALTLLRDNLGQASSYAAVVAPSTVWCISAHESTKSIQQARRVQLTRIDRLL